MECVIFHFQDQYIEERLFLIYKMTLIDELIIKEHLGNTDHYVIEFCTTFGETVQSE